MATDAQARGWGPGWPHANTARIKTLVRRDGLRLPVRQEILPLVAWLMDETERLGYDIRPDWTWGFANRPIRGSNTPSNHSWGLAVDINAPRNPMGSRLITDMPAWMPKLWADYGFRWGGTYRSRPDAMHYEFMGTPADAARYIAQITKPADPNKGRPWRQSAAGANDRAIYAKGGRNDQIAELQILVGFTGRDVDGFYGPNTVAAVVALKRAAGWMTEDGKKRDESSVVTARFMDALRHLAGGK